MMDGVLWGQGFFETNAFLFQSNKVEYFIQILL